jgi:hypothetical protein
MMMLFSRVVKSLCAGYMTQFSGKIHGYNVVLLSERVVSENKCVRLYECRNFDYDSIRFKLDIWSVRETITSPSKHCLEVCNDYKWINTTCKARHTYRLLSDLNGYTVRTDSRWIVNYKNNKMYSKILRQRFENVERQTFEKFIQAHD